MQFTELCICWRLVCKTIHNAQNEQYETTKKVHKFLVQVMKACRGSRGIAPLIPNLGTT